MKRVYVGVMMAGLLAACDPASPPVSGPSSEEAPARNVQVQSAPDLSLCEANRYQYLTGQKGTALERVLIMREMRVIRPGMMVTMDFRPTRLNFEINTHGLIERVFCG